jgi:tetratricopeptide (TPR) repeat protein
MFLRLLTRLTGGPAKGWGRRWVAVSLVLFVLGLAPLAVRWCYTSWHIHMARQALAEGQPQVAVLALRKVESLQPGRAETQFLLGRSLRRSGALDDAAACFDKAAGAGWPDDEIRLQRQLMLVQTGHFAQAGDFLKDILRKGASDETAEEVYEARAQGFYATYRFSDALLCIDFWLKWRPHARNAHLWRAEICERTERWQDAVCDYRAILAQDPRDGEVYTRLGDALLQLHDTEAALHEYEKRLALRPDDMAALLGTIRCHRRMGEVADLNNRLSLLLDRGLDDKQRGDVLYELGEISLFQQKYEQAVDYLTRAHQADPANWLVLHPLSTAYARLGMRELAADTRRRSEQCIERSQRLAKFTRQVLEDPRNAQARYEAGMILIAEGMKKEGAAWLATALECDPQHEKSHLGLAEYYAEAGNSDLAANHRKRAENAERPTRDEQKNGGDLPNERTGGLTPHRAPVE